MIKASGTAIVVEKSAGQRYLISSYDLDWEYPDEEDRGTGQGCVFAATCFPNGLELLRWEIVEYPYGSIQKVTFHSSSINIEQDFSFCFDLEQVLY